jgi:hypothetical protein
MKTKHYNKKRYLYFKVVDFHQEYSVGNNWPYSTCERAISFLLSGAESSTKRATVT